LKILSAPGMIRHRRQYELRSDLDLTAMVEGSPGVKRSGQTLIFSSVKPGFDATAFVGIMIIAIAFVADRSNTWSMPANAGAVVGFLFIACIIGLSASRQWTAEIDMTSRRLRISRLSFGRWTRTIVDCPLDECSVFGTIGYSTDGHVSYGVYVQLKRGTRHAIPLKNSTFNEAARVASQLSAATGIPRLDTIF
jgi:hypothetical protein